MSIVQSAKHTHTTFETLDVEQSLRFYREVLGLSTTQHLPKAGLFCSTNHHVTACVQLPKVSAQPYWNYHARPVPKGTVDAIHARVAAVAQDHAVREIRPPAVETQYGIGTYGFGICDRDGNWWRIEENDGPFGFMDIPALDSTSIVPAGPISYVTLQAYDIAATADFYRDVLDLPVETKSGAIHSRARDGGVNLVTVPADGALIAQPVLNHHGITLPEDAQDEVAVLRSRIDAEGGRFGVRKVQPVTSQHGSVQFYFQDRDTNWWEIETLWHGLDPWQRATLPDGDARLLDATRGRSKMRQPFRTLVEV